MTRALLIACCVLAPLAALAAPAAAQLKPFTPDPVDMAAAKREAAVTWYTSTPVNTAQKIANMFQTETGIKVELFRSGGSAVLRRFMQEIDIWPADGAFAIGAPSVVIKGAPHPNAAKALAEFMISDAVQKLLPGERIYAGRSDVEPPPGNPPISQIKLIPVDYDQVEKDAKAIKTRFNDIYQ